MGGALTDLDLPYSDNDAASVGARLVAEIKADPARLDVCSGYFAPSVWAAIGDGLERLDRFRLLLGADHELDALRTEQESRNVAQLVRRAIAREATPDSLVTQEVADQTLALIAFLERHQALGDEVVKLWRGDGFLHAKAYILDACAGIGSANFTYAGMERNRELVGWRQDRSAVREVRGWFERLWEHQETVPYTEELLRALRETPLVSDTYTPYDVLIRTLAARYGTDRPPSLEQAKFTLQWFQEDAVFRLVRLLNGPARGALLADAVGLGKTYMALGVIHHFLYQQAERRGRGRPVLLLAPAALKPMWDTILEEQGLGWACNVITLQSLRRDFDPGPLSGADLVVIDEAHRLRSGGTWWRAAMDLVMSGEHAADRRVLLLTATPVNTGMGDLDRLLALMTKGRRNAWAPEVADFSKHLERVERDGADPFPLLDRSLVRRSRSDLLRAWDEARAAGLAVAPVKLPKREALHIDYGYDTVRHDLFDRFAQGLRGLALAPYDLDRYRRVATGDATHVTGVQADEISENEHLRVRPGTLAALYAAGLLTRFQSSVPAVRRSLFRLDGVLARFLQALEQSPARVLDLSGDPAVRRLVADEAAGRDRDGDEHLSGDDGGLDDEELEKAWEEALARAPEIEDPDALDVTAIRSEVTHDRTIVADLLAGLPGEADDGKVAALLTALSTSPRDGRPGAPGLAGQRVLVFSQFRDTATYVHRRLVEHQSSLGRALLVHGGIAQAGRAQATAWFDPGREADTMAARVEGEQEPTLLVSTDVLAEGHNLQRASAIVNFDLHFNPQVAVQRAGRVDRLNSPHDRVFLVSMLPPESLNAHIGLLARLDERFRRIHGLGLGDERSTPLGADEQGRTLEQLRRLYRDDATVLDEIERSWTFGSTDFMRQPLSAFLSAAGQEHLAAIPYGVSSIKWLPEDWPHGDGVFVAFAAPSAGSGTDSETYWRFLPEAEDGSYSAPLRDDVAIFRAIACREGEPRAPSADVPPGPGIFDWSLIRTAAEGLAKELRLQRAQADVARGASERSRRLRTELRAGTEALGVEGLDDLLERLLQVRVEDFAGRSGWRHFEEARRRLRRADSAAERFAATTSLVADGRELFGPPVDEDDELRSPPSELQADDLRLVAYEVLRARVRRTVRPAEVQLELRPGAS